MANGEYTAKVSEKGAISLYGIRRFPISFYADEWEILFELAPKIRAFAKKHKSELKQKETSSGPEGAEAL